MEHLWYSIIILLIVCIVCVLISFFTESFKNIENYYGLLNNVLPEKGIEYPKAQDYIPPDIDYRECPSKVTQRYYEDDEINPKKYILVENLVTKDTPIYIPLLKNNLSLL